MKIFTADTLSKAAVPMVAAFLIGGSTAVISSARENAVQSQQISDLQLQQQRTEDAVERLNETASKLDKNVAVLNERLQGHSDVHR